MTAEGKNLKVIGRSLAKLAHSNPMVVFDKALTHAEVYENFISPTVESLNFMTNFSFDVLSFMLIQHLSSESKNKLDTSHEGFVAQWFKNLAIFCGVFYKAKPNVEIQGLLALVIQKLNEVRAWNCM